MIQSTCIKIGLILGVLLFLLVFSYYQPVSGQETPATSTNQTSLPVINQEKRIKILIEKLAIEQEEEFAKKNLINSNRSVVVLYLLESLNEVDFGFYGRKKEAIIKLLGEMKEQRAIAPLIAILAKGTPYRLDKNITNSLIEIGKAHSSAFTIYIQKLDDPNIEVVISMTYILGQIKNKRAEKPLIQKLNHKNPDVRIEATKALCFLGSSEALNLLYQILMSDKNESKCQDAAEVLKKIGWIPKTTKEKVKYYIALQNWYEAIKIGDPAKPYLLEVLRKDSWNTRLLLAKELNREEIAPDAIVIFTEYLKNGKRGEKWMAFRCLKCFQNYPKAIAVIKPYLEDKVLHDILELGASAWGWGGEEGNSKYAAHRLGDSGDKRAIKPLEEVIKSQMSTWNRDSKLIDACQEALDQLERYYPELVK